MSEVRELSHNIVKANEVIGIAVKNSQLDRLGEIDNLVLDKFSGQTVYVVLSFGGFLGMGDKLFALPWKAIHFNAAEECFILNVDKDKLKNAPGFDKDNWPDMADSAWGKSIYNYYGTPYWEDQI